MGMNKKVSLWGTTLVEVSGRNRILLLRDSWWRSNAIVAFGFQRKSFLHKLSPCYRILLLLGAVKGCAWLLGFSIVPCSAAGMTINDGMPQGTLLILTPHIRLYELIILASPELSPNADELWSATIFAERPCCNSWVSFTWQPLSLRLLVSWW